MASTTPHPAPLHRWHARLLLWLPTLALLGAVLPLHAESAAEDVADPPARVGRVSVLRGPVELSREPGAAWEATQINQPVTTQTALWVPPGSQAELRIGSAAVRMDGNTQAVFSQLDDHGIAIDVAQGVVRVRLRNLPTGDAFSLSADGVRAEALVPGDYRVDYDPDLRALTVRTLAGRLRVVTPTNSMNLEAGQEARLEHSGATLQVNASGARDDFDRWAEARDREHDRLIASRYVSPEATGIEALDEHGRWEIDPGYGAIWYPSGMPYGWAPYRYGHWAWVAPWGWTWIDDSAWGFAPFHYGRWALLSGRWGWVPGPIVARPCYAPALVAFVGGRSGQVQWNIGIGSTPIGWFPLAPTEVYRPPYRHSVTYVNQVNVVREVTRHRVLPRDPQHPRDRRRENDAHPRGDDAHYRYARRPEALTVVSEEQFRAARPVGRHRLQIAPGQAATLKPLAAMPPDNAPREQRHRDLANGPRALPAPPSHGMVDGASPHGGPSSRDRAPRDRPPAERSSDSRRRSADAPFVPQPRDGNRAAPPAPRGPRERGNAPHPIRQDLREDMSHRGSMSEPQAPHSRPSETNPRSDRPPQGRATAPMQAPAPWSRSEPRTMRPPQQTPDSQVPHAEWPQRQEGRSDRRWSPSHSWHRGDAPPRSSSAASGRAEERHAER